MTSRHKGPKEKENGSAVLPGLAAKLAGVVGQEMARLLFPGSTTQGQVILEAALAKKNGWRKILGWHRPREPSEPCFCSLVMTSCASN